MQEEECSEQHAPQGGGTTDDESRNDGGDWDSSQKWESSEDPRRALHQNEKKSRYTQPPPAQQIRIPKSGARRTSEATGGRKVEPMDPNGRSEPQPSLQGVNAIGNEI